MRFNGLWRCCRSSFSDFLSECVFVCVCWVDSEWEKDQSAQKQVTQSNLCRFALYRFVSLCVASSWVVLCCVVQFARSLARSLACFFFSLDR